VRLKGEITVGRQIFEVPRAGEYFSIDELQAQTGQPVENFGAVVLKELVDNALDACENDSVPPEIVIQITGESIIGISVLDNASGIAPKTVERILNFHTRTSDKAAYRIPSRGAQGNAIKTVIGIPVALGCETPTIIESQNVQHTIRPRPDPAGNVTIDHHTKDNGCQGTQVIVTLPGDKQKLKPRYWARSFALFNPHAVIKISSFGNFFKQAYEDNKTHEIYHRTVTFPRGWRKFLPDAPTSIYWYRAIACSLGMEPAVLVVYFA
jgi:DNA topoisomerase VI subunit B